MDDRRREPQRLDPARPDLDDAANAVCSATSKPSGSTAATTPTPRASARRRRDRRRGDREEAQARIDRGTKNPADGTALAGRANELVASPTSATAQKHRSQDRCTARAVRPRRHFPAHGEAHRLPKPLVTGPVAYPLSLLDGDKGSPGPGRGARSATAESREGDGLASELTHPLSLAVRMPPGSRSDRGHPNPVQSFGSR